MLLAIDVGNTNITVGVFDGKDIKKSFRITTNISRTSDEFGSAFKSILNLNGLEMGDITDVVVASVVPNVMHSLLNSISKYFSIKPLIIEAGVKTGIRIATYNPKEIGADRIVDAVGAYEIYGGPVIVLDFGTATTYDLVDSTGAFLAGVTAPGIRTSARAIALEAAKLPEFEIKKPKSILAQDTVTSLQAGLLYGQIGQTEYIVKTIKEESGLENIKVVATGGLGRLISQHTNCIDVYDPDLTLHGMRIIFDKQKK